MTVARLSNPLTSIDCRILFSSVLVVVYLWPVLKSTARHREARHHVTMHKRHQRYIGDFDLHRHILDHVDQGMVQNIRIAIPDGAGGIALRHD